MASVRKNDIPVEGAFMPVFWEMVKKFWIQEDTDDYWTALCAYAEEMIKRFPTKFCEYQVLAYVKYQDDKFRRRK